METIGRNDACWCGSGKKYKKCHCQFDEKLKELQQEGHIINLLCCNSSFNMLCNIIQNSDIDFSAFFDLLNLFWSYNTAD